MPIESRYVRAALIVAVASMTAASAQVWSATPAGTAFYAFVQHPDAPALYVGMREAFETDRVENLGRAVVASLHDAIDDADSGVCIFTAGHGTNPKWDGGGTLAVWSEPVLGVGSLPAFTGERFAPPSSLEAWPFAQGSATRPIVIIDEFDLAALAATAYTRGTVAGPIPLRPDPVLWETLYGVFVSLDPDQDYLVVDVPHGHLVLYQLLLALRSSAEHAIVGVQRLGADHAVLYIDAPGADPEGRAFGRSDAALEVHLLAVQFDEPSSITAALRNAHAVHGPAPERRRPVVVMSWGLVDCAISDAYLKTNADPDGNMLASYVEYVHSLVLALPEERRDELLRDACATFTGLLAPFIIGGDPYACVDASTLTHVTEALTLAALAATDVAARRAVEWDVLDHPEAVTFVASAGNQALSFPMPPAAWDGVFGVAACHWDEDHETVAYSNAPGFTQTERQASERVHALGGWYVAPIGSQDPVLGYYGTSFAAPVAAAFAAIEPGWPGATPATDPLRVPPCR